MPPKKAPVKKKSRANVGAGGLIWPKKKKKTGK
jgi:hypothetical protein